MANRIDLANKAEVDALRLELRNALNGFSVLPYRISDGPPTDAPEDGQLPTIDTTNSRLYIRANGAWRYTELGDADLGLTAEQLAALASVPAKADQDVVDAALALKADQDDVTTALATKVNSSTYTAGLALKAGQTAVDTALTAKASTAALDAEVQARQTGDADTLEAAATDATDKVADEAAARAAADALKADLIDGTVPEAQLPDFATPADVAAVALTQEQRDRIAEVPGKEAGDVRHVYVNAATGSDDNSGVLKSKPKATVQAALAAVNGLDAELDIAPATYTFTDPLTYDPMRVKVKANGSTFDMTALTAGPAVALTASASSNRRLRTALSDVKIIGPGRTSSVDGVFVNGLSESADTSRLLLVNVEVLSFRDTLTFGANAYCTLFFNCGFASSSRAVYQATGAANSGERQTFMSCIFANSITGVQSDHGSGALHLFGCSIDYNHRASVFANGGHITLTDCHVETGNANTAYPDALIQTAGNDGSVVIHGGLILLNNNTTPVRDYIFSSQSTGGSGGIFVRDTHLHNLATTTGRLKTGTGRFETSGVHTFGISGFVAAGGRSALADGGFVSASLVVDDWFVLNGTSRLASSAVTLAASTDTAYDGSNALKVTKTGNGATAASWSLLVPIQKGDRASYSLRVKKTDSTSGNIFIAFKPVKVVAGSVVGVPSTYTTVAPGSTTIALTSSPMDWTQFSANWTTPAPEWATHFEVAFNGFSWSASSGGSIYIDDVNVWLL